jgi:hypothetical protein
MIRLNIRTILAVAAGGVTAGAFAIIDQYIINVSSYLVGGLLAFWIIERRS